MGQSKLDNISNYAKLSSEASTWKNLIAIEMTFFEFKKKVNDSLIRQEQDAGSESLAMINYVVL